MLVIEALITNTETVLMHLVPKNIASNGFPIYYHNKGVVYSDALDEVLNYTELTYMSDSTSTIYIFDLDDPMYTMAECHNIGLKSYQDASLIIEILDEPCDYV